MSRIDITTQDLFMRLGATSMSRRAKADALFRRLRLDAQDSIGEKLLRAPSRLSAEDIDPASAGVTNIEQLKKAD